MGSKREDVDLELVLRDPVCARQWIEDYLKRQTLAPKFIVVEEGCEIVRTIYFDKMTDDEAVEAAFHILQDSEIRQAVYELNLLDPDRSVH